MKLTLDTMAQAAWTMTRKKFMALSAKRQHELLMALAIDTFLKGGTVYSLFQTRYRELHSFGALDRYEPPPWLSEKEALLEYGAFHNQYTPSPHPLPPRKEKTLPRNPLSWTHRFDVTILLDQVTRPYNVGSILRIIDNFGLKGLVHGTKSLDISHPQLRKSARGCEKWIPVTYEERLAPWIETLSMPVIGIETDPGAIPLHRFSFPLPCAIVVGNETLGISERVRGALDAIVNIPMYGFKKSMNVTHALSVVAYQITAAAFSGISSP